MIEKALKIASKAHKMQKDKNGKPYINHPIAVSNMVSSKDAKIVALLHDVIEDTPMKLSDLENDFPTHIVSAVDAMSRRDGETYWDYIKRVSQNPIAIEVKLADLKHNLDPTRRFKNDEGMRKRYEKSLEMLKK